jgi:solute carrier family 25 phosphate transporter 3
MSHGITVPIDVLKTKKQVSKELAQLGLVDGFKRIVEEDGIGVLFKGLSPTLIGYAIQGSLKYGFYEVFKPIVKVFLSNHGIQGNQLLQFALASILAETIGATVLAPAEAARIRMVTIPNYSNGLGSALQRMVQTEGTGSLFRR